MRDVLVAYIDDEGTRENITIITLIMRTADSAFIENGAAPVGTGFIPARNDGQPQGLSLQVGIWDTQLEGRALCRDRACPCPCV